MSDLFWKKIRAVVAHAVDGLEEADRRSRMAAISSGAEPEGVSALRVGEAVEFRWAGSPLAVVSAADLEDPEVSVEQMLTGEFITGDFAIPDFGPDDLWRPDVPRGPM